ncbi:hypothetical protein AMELA_G00085960 [Ameiurus melas]|uniref:Uncharacterized protein n=1 Tax=Ameiurus melas TaxID=219545 RepID=A0A7J6AWV0_AMEME|nr:hypothetical protein AMELA_G00085960 [Ameiurus melas]
MVVMYNSAQKKKRRSWGGKVMKKSVNGVYCASGESPPSFCRRLEDKHSDLSDLTWPSVVFSSHENETEQEQNYYKVKIYNFPHSVMNRI